MENHLEKELNSALRSMFRKNFVGIFHGSLSAKVEEEKFIINTRNAIFDNLKEDDFIELYTKKDYRWTNASIDADIHLSVYQNISEAKYLSYTMAPFMTSYALNHEEVVPKDYFGTQIIGTIPVYDPGDFESWYTRAKDEIYLYLQKNNTDMILIRGYGLYTFNRDITTLIKKIAILENSCKLLLRAPQNTEPRNFPLS